MAIDREFSHVGVVTLRGVSKLKWSNGQMEMREAFYREAGATHVEYVQMPQPMTKTAALETDLVKDLVTKFGIKLPGTKEAKPAKAAKPTKEPKAAKSTKGTDAVARERTVARLAKEIADKRAGNATTDANVEDTATQPAAEA
jgi:hypothetical protein